MADPLVHENLLHLLALELPWSAGELGDMLRANPDNVGRIGDAIEGSGLAEQHLVLEEPLGGGANGAPLVAASVALTPRKLRSLLTRQLQNPGEPLGPIVVRLDDATLARYRKRIANRLETLITQVREHNAGNIQVIHRRIASAPPLACVQETFDTLVAEVLASPASLLRILPSLADSRTDSTLTVAINAAFVSMAALLLYERFPDTSARQDAISTVGMAALLQDFSRLTDPELGEVEHLGPSADIARELGAPEAVAALILRHHAVQDADGEPLLRHNGEMGSLARVLITTNVFLGEVGQRGAGQGFETMKNLGFLAECGLIDRKAFEILSRLYLPKLKAAVLEKTSQLAALCPTPGSSPILWPISGDKLPSVFLCRSSFCEHRTSQLSRLAVDIPFIVEGRTVATIPKGSYFTCPFLTSRLKSLYAAIQTHVER